MRRTLLFLCVFLLNTQTILFSSSVPDILTGSQGETIIGKGTPSEMALSPDQKTMATGSLIGIFLWDYANKASEPYAYIPIDQFFDLSKYIRRHNSDYGSLPGNRPYYLEFLDNNRIIAGRNNVSIFDVQDGAKITSYPVEDGDTSELVTVSGDKRWIFGLKSYNDAVFRKWDIKTGKLVSQYNYNGSFDNRYWISSTGRYLIYPQGNLNVNIIDTEKWENQNEDSCEISVSWPFYAEDIQFSDDEKFVYSIGQNHLIYYSIHDNKIISDNVLPNPSDPSLKLYPQKDQILFYDKLVLNAEDVTPVRIMEISDINAKINGNIRYGLYGDNVYTCDILTGKMIWKSCYHKDTRATHEMIGFYEPFAYLPATKEVYALGLIYDLNTNKSKKISMEGSVLIPCAGNGDLFYIYDVDLNLVYGYESENGQKIKSFKINGSPQIITPDNKFIIVARTDNKSGSIIVFYDLSDGIEKKSFTIPSGLLNHLKFSAMGDEIIIPGFATYTIQYPSLNPITKYDVGGYDADFGDNPDELYIAGFNENIVQYNRKTNKIVNNFQPVYDLRKLDKIRNANYFLVVSTTCCHKDPYLLNSKDMNPVDIPLAIEYAKIIDNNKKVITVSCDGAVRIWDLSKFIPIDSSVSDYKNY